MIRGVVTADREAIVRLVVRGLAGQEQEVDAVIDTGFDGSLTLPPSLIGRLQLAWRRRGRALLADGSESIFDIHEGNVLWDGRLVRVSIDSAEMAPLIGMSLVEGYKLTVEVRTHGEVTIEPLP
jgi:clan AA aspartic protease